MIQKIKLLLIVLLFSASANAQTTQEEKRVQQAVENMFATLASADTAALKNFVTAGVRFYEYGQSWTIDSLIRIVTPTVSVPDFKRTNFFTFVKTTVRKNTAWVTYHLQSVITANGKEQTAFWMETVILVKEKKEWKIEVLHSTRLMKNEANIKSKSEK